MKKVILTRFILYVCWSLLYWPPLACCQQVTESPFKSQFKRSATISDKSGKPKNVEVWYFPAEKFVDSSEVRIRVPKDQINESMRTDPRYDILPNDLILERKVRTRVDTVKLNVFSYYLYKLKAPVLSNFPLGEEVYRFTLLRSFHPPIMLSLKKRGDVIQLDTKILRNIPEIPGHRYSSPNGAIHVADTSAHIPFKVNTSKRISIVAYDEFIQLVDKLNVRYSPPLGFTKSFGTDGSEWILEMHQPDGYYFLIRWSPKDDQPIHILGNYLLDLSDAKNEIRY